MMDFNEFASKLENNMKVALEDGPLRATVSRNEVEKLQGESYSGLVIHPKDSNLSMNLNLNSLYEQMQQGASYQTIVAQTLNRATEFLQNTPQFDVNSIADYTQAKNHLFVDVVGVEKNAEMLAKVPHTKVEDMALVYRVEVNRDGDGIASTLISNALLKEMGVSKEQLHQDALANAAEMHPMTMRKLSEVLAEMTGMPVEMMEGSTPPLYVISNTDAIKGASAMFYPEAMETFSKEIGGDFFALPSSIHEVLLLPDDGFAKAEELKDMVSAINGDVVDPADVLTDQVYHYDSKDHIFEKGERFEARQTEKQAMKQERSSVLSDLKEKQKDIGTIPKSKETRAKSEPEL